MEKSYHQIAQNQRHIKEALSKKIAQTGQVVFLESNIKEWFQKSDKINKDILHALRNTPEDAKIEYVPDIQTQIEFIQKYQAQTAQTSNTSDWLLPLAAAFGVGFMLGGE